MLLDGAVEVVLVPLLLEPHVEHVAEHLEVLGVLWFVRGVAEEDLLVDVVDRVGERDGVEFVHVLERAAAPWGL